MYCRDHAPPHFHAEYGEYEITIEIETGIVEGRFPKHALTADLEWYAERRQELSDNWNRARQELPLEPLE